MGGSVALARSAEQLLDFLRKRVEVRPDLKGQAKRRHEARELQAVAEARGLSKPEAVKLAMATKSKLWIEYARKRDGSVLEYHVAPYERGMHHGKVRKPVLWATDHKHGGGQIHAFLWSRIKSAEPRLLANFRPVWPVRTETA